MNLKRLFNRIVRRKNSGVKIAIGIVVVFVGIGLVAIPMFKSLTSPSYRAKLLRENPALVRLLPLYWKLRKVSDLTYFAYAFKKDEIPTYDLEIKPEDILTLNDSLPEGFGNVIYTDPVWVPAKFSYGGEEYDVDVRYRGANAIHWNAPKKSYLVKFDKDKLFNGIRRLSFIIVDDRYFAMEQLNNYRADKLGLLHPPSSFANLHVNGRNHGAYFVIENWSQEMLAKWEVPDETNFYGEENLGEDGITRSDTLWDNLDRWEKLVDDSQFNYDHYSELYTLLDLLHNASDEQFNRQIFTLVDQENFYNWQVHQELINSAHQVFGNVRLLFNNTSGKFYFVPWDVESDYAYRNNVGLYGTLARRIFSNPKFLHKKNKLLYTYASDKDNLEDDLNYYDETYDKIKTSVYKDRLKVYTNRFADSVYQDHREKIINNFNRASDIFDDFIIFVDVNVTDDNSQTFLGQSVLAYFDAHVQSLADFFVREVDVEFVDEEVFSDFKLYYDYNNNGELDNSDTLISEPSDALLSTKRVSPNNNQQYTTELTRHRIFIVSQNITSEQFSSRLADVSFNFVNAITDRKVKKGDVRVKIINGQALARLAAITDVEGFKSSYPQFLINESSKEIILPAGSYFFTNTVIVPQGYTLRLLPGTVIRLSGGTSIISYSNVIAEGTPVAPIQIIGLTTEPWGVFGVLNSDLESRFRYFIVDNGKDAYVNGVYMSGMLSIYHNDVVIERLTASRANADDALNVKSAKAKLSNSTFTVNSADAVDFDFIKEGEISNNLFVNNGNDGIDLSGSTVLINQNTIHGSGDKCISVGERSVDTVIYNNVLNECLIGIEIKDASDVQIINNVIVNNDIGLNAYVKKPVFGGGVGRVYNSIIWDNQIDVQVDEQSEINVNFSDIKDYEGEGNINIYPVLSQDFTISPATDTILFVNSGNKQVLKDWLGIDWAEAPIGLNL
ncbi:MAG: hypothetical protein COT81_04660 [Candidatus Buchananbacteria bacterium CG10_big_fil_rev_8_21_14_0_10_42_9]|uniref:Right handed beta helix domain-containing protein n=1 Tax=Candidatus Buchananbacteria bacterium CG10_big_fil_rev_8_21_14_0_10_42_9 TaxID=1974526 RepID=A0A2H0W2F9_9BACT|nr:MAG: hypothetical protein COT81_04660 [Candidatus Buchananbacteria bacterium CG10_big_fil_rev_8_21_14_0_10_42_9]